MKQEHFPAVGAASLFTAFAVLLLTLLSLLSIAQAQADRRLSKTMAQSTKAYYAADLEANRICAGIRRGNIPPDVSEENGSYAFLCPVSDYQTLFVELDKATFQVLRWQVVAHPETPNENLSVWTG